MGRYTYLGPYSLIEFEDNGVKKTISMGQTLDIEDEAFIDDLVRRGFHQFAVVSGDTPVTPVAPAPEPPAETGEQPPEGEVAAPSEEQPQG